MDLRSYVRLLKDNSAIDFFANSGTEIFSFLFLPSIISGLALGYAFIQLPNFGRKHGRLIFIVACLLVLTPLALLFPFFINGSELIVFYQNALLWLIGFVCILPAFQQTPRRDRLKQVGIVAFGLVMAAFFSWRIVGDFFLPRKIVSGVVTARELSDGYELMIDGRKYETTRTVFRKTEKGQSIRAEVGDFSGMVFRVQPAITPR